MIEGAVDGHGIEILIFLDEVGLVWLYLSFEIGGLVHIKPNPCKFYLFVQFRELILPECRCIGMQKINIVDLSRPYLPQIVIFIRFPTPQKNLHIPCHFRSDAIFDSNANIQKRNQFDIILLEK